MAFLALRALFWGKKFPLQQDFCEIPFALLRKTSTTFCPVLGLDDTLIELSLI